MMMCECKKEMKKLVLLILWYDVSIVVLFINYLFIEN